MKYAVYGAGSLGIVFSAYLAQAREDFTLVDRNPKSVEAIKQNGVKVTGEANLEAPVKIALETKLEDKFDLIFLFSKQINNLETIKKVARMLSPSGVICTMQNGLPEIEVASVIGENRTYGAAVGFGATRTDYGISMLTSKATRESLSFSLGSFNNNDTPVFKEIKRILNIVGNVSVETNFIGARYAKLIINSSFSGMSTVCGATFGEVAKNKKSRKVIQMIIKECIDVAKAKNIKVMPIQGKDIVKLLDYRNKLKKFFGFLIIPIAIKKHAALKASMLQDIEKGLPCEIDSINQIICKLGEEANIKTPFNDKVVEIIKKEEAKELVPSFLNVSLFDSLF